MTYTVRILPAGKSFSAEPHETLVEAALRSGVDIPYNCNNGSCGGCKARLLQGETGPSRHHDFVLAEAEKQAGTLLLCVSTAASDLVVELTEGEAQPPYQEIDARIERVQQTVGNYLLLQLRTPRTRTLRFQAGQTVRLRLAGGEARQLPVASCPCNGMVLEFHLPLDGSDPFAQRLLGARGHVTVHLDGPFGNRGLDDASRRPLLFIAEGALFAAAKSLIEHAIALELPQSMTLIWLSPAGGHYLDNYCRSLVDALDDFSYMPLELARWGAAAGQLPGLVSQPADLDVYLVTWPALADAVAEGFVAAGTPPGRIFRWRPGMIAPPGV